jgi:hypothetical protein
VETRRGSSPAAFLTSPLLRRGSSRIGPKTRRGSGRLLATQLPGTDISATAATAAAIAVGAGAVAPIGGAAVGVSAIFPNGRRSSAPSYLNPTKPPAKLEKTFSTILRDSKQQISDEIRRNSVDKLSSPGNITVTNAIGSNSASASASASASGGASGSARRGSSSGSGDVDSGTSAVDGLEDDDHPPPNVAILSELQDLLYSASSASSDYYDTDDGENYSLDASRGSARRGSLMGFARRGSTDSNLERVAEAHDEDDNDEGDGEGDDDKDSDDDANDNGNGGLGRGESSLGNKGGAQIVKSMVIKALEGADKDGGEEGEKGSDEYSEDEDHVKESKYGEKGNGTDYDNGDEVHNVINFASLGLDDDVNKTKRNTGRSSQGSSSTERSNAAKRGTATAAIDASGRDAIAKSMSKSHSHSSSYSKSNSLGDSQSHDPGIGSIRGIALGLGLSQSLSQSTVHSHGGRSGDSATANGHANAAVTATGSATTESTDDEMDLEEALFGRKTSIAKGLTINANKRPLTGRNRALSALSIGSSRTASEDDHDDSSFDARLTNFTMTSRNSSSAAGNIDYDESDIDDADADADVGQDLR